VKVRVDALPNREWAAWAGGSVLAGLSHFEELWIERDDYDDVGPRIVHSKCF
jgi:actin